MRRHRRLSQVLTVVTLLLALAASILLRHGTVAWAIWPAAAVICLATAWTTRARRP
jgi:hypothetical protein